MSMSERLTEYSTGDSDHVITNPPSYTASMSEPHPDQTQSSNLPHSVLEDSPTSPPLPSARETPISRGRQVTSVVQAEINSACSLDTLSVTPHPISGRKHADIPTQDASSLRGSRTSLYPTSPRPGSRGSRRSLRRGSGERVRRGEMLMELARTESIRSRESRKSKRDLSRSSRRRRNSAASTSSTTGSSSSRRSAGNAGMARHGKRDYITAHDAVSRGQRVCGCVLKSRLIYFSKPVLFLVFGSLFIIGGVTLTVFHFMYEDVVGEVGGASPSTNVPYFTWGPITLSTGVIIFMIGLVWVPIKEQKWKDGTASPMLEALELWHRQNDSGMHIKLQNISSNQISDSAEKICETDISHPRSPTSLKLLSESQSKPPFSISDSPTLRDVDIV